MPKRTDIEKILILGSGPIVIGQACEFDYSGTQACKALREEGYQVVLINSNPATIMTDPEFADRTYIEPITPQVVEQILEQERPQAVLPTLGGQTALNIAVALARRGVLDRLGIELIGAKLNAIEKAEDRDLFKQAMIRIGLEVPRSGVAHSLEEALRVVEEVGFPAILRPSFTLGGSGGSVAYNREEYVEYVEHALDTSPERQVLIEESALGWKEFELEVMRDRKDNFVVICSIENFDPMGIHTGDSITVAPAQTLTDKEYERMRDAAAAIIREIGVETGGSNIQFALHPKTGRMVVIEMNPRVSRSSALASKATGFPIAKIAAKLAVGYTLDEVPNDITRETPASFEPTIDYVVVKIPRFTFEKFPSADPVLTTQMKSVGEAMALGRTFQEALQKAVRSLEIDRSGFDPREGTIEEIQEKIRTPNADRLWYVAEALRRGSTTEEVHRLSSIDPWFLDCLGEILRAEGRIAREMGGRGAHAWTEPILREAKRMGFSDRRLAALSGLREDEVRRARERLSVRPAFKIVDTCAAEFAARTPYLYSTYESTSEAPPTDRKKVIILGGGPNRIGQGIEFDYCCVHACFALEEEGYETLMVNCNPETVSTDYDTSDRLYFEPLTFEDVMAIVERERPEGVIVQFGGQTPLKLAQPLARAGVRILGTSPDSIDAAEDRERFRTLLIEAGLKQPESGTARTYEEAEAVARRIGFPVLVRPSYVLGGRAMEIVYDPAALRGFVERAVAVSGEHPILIDKFLEGATEVDVDAISDGSAVVVAGILEHIEEAGVHSGDSAMALPPFALPRTVIEEIERGAKALALGLHVVGLMNVQFAVKGSDVYILEVNPRASRTVPFVSKAIGVPLAKLATRLMVGRTLAETGFTEPRIPRHVSVKESVFPFVKLPGVDTILGPEMKSTGEVMGIDRDFPRAFAKAQLAAGTTLPTAGTVFVSVNDRDKEAIVEPVRRLHRMGFQIVATRGTAAHLDRSGIPARVVQKVQEGRPHVVDALKNRSVDLVLNTVFGARSIADSFAIRRTALIYGVPYFTTVEGARAAVGAIETLKAGALGVRALQDYHAPEARAGKAVA